VLHVRELSVRYGPVVALEGVSLEVPAGQCVLVTGPSGCGKSTLARVLAEVKSKTVKGDLPAICYP
jgi:ABC-type nitrate/sulfonate/bicarbonate transport system ATPase subunit